MTKYFKDEINRVDEFVESEKNPLDVKLDDTLLIVFQNEEGLTVRHRQSIPPVMLREIAEKIVQIAKKLTQ